MDPLERNNVSFKFSFYYLILCFACEGMLALYELKFLEVYKPYKSCFFLRLIFGPFTTLAWNVFSLFIADAVQWFQNIFRNRYNLAY